MTQPINNHPESAAPVKIQFKVFNETKSSIVADKADMADTFWSRMVGLLGRKEINRGEGLIITRCNSIHMFFMRFAIDVIFVSKDDKIVGLVKNIKPWQLSPVFFKSSYVIELPCGVIDSTYASLGDKIRKIQLSPAQV